MKFTFYLASIALIFSLLHAQAQAGNYGEYNYLHQMSTKGTPEMEGENIEGTPFIFPEWCRADLITVEGKTIGIAQLNYQAKRHKFYYIRNNDYYEIFPDQVKMIIVKLPDNSKRYFVTKLPHPIETKIQTPYYEIFTDDISKAYVVNIPHKIFRSKSVSQSYASEKSNETMEYVDRSRAYVLVNGKYVRYRHSFKQLKKIFGWDKKTAKKFKKFIKNKHLKIKKLGDLQTFMAYYYRQKSAQ